MGLDYLSRRHSQLTFENGRVFIEDAGSSFGTLKFLQEPVVLSPINPSFVLQINNKLIILAVQLERQKTLKMKKISRKGDSDPNKTNAFP